MNATDALSSDFSPLPLEARRRTGVGKGESSRLRAQGRIPAIAYGKHLPSTPLSVSPTEVDAVLKSKKGRNTVLRLDLGTHEELLVMVRDYSYHPIHRTLLHVDFVEVKLSHPVEVHVPFSCTGKPEGVTAGGIVRQVYRTLPIRCLPDRIPVSIVVDITALHLNEHIAPKDLAVQEGIEIMLPQEQTLIAVVKPEKDRDADNLAPSAAAPAAAAAPSTKKK